MPQSIPKFHRFVGHKRQVDLLRRQLVGAKARGEPFPPTLFSGPSGVGKTLLAESLAAEYGTVLTLANGYDSVAELSDKFLRVNVCDFVFIDEAHNLTAKSQELLYHVIDQSRIPLWDQKGNDASEPDTQYEDVQPCAVILATDQPGKLRNALEKRMELNIRMGYYTQREMKEIVDRLAADLGLLISPQASNQIARISGGLPRKARHHLQNLRRHFLDAEQRQIGVPEVRQFLREFGIDSKGLGKVERDYLRHLLQTASASLDSLALHLGMDADFVRRQIEPTLRRAGFIVIGSGGRRLTETGRNWITQASKTRHEERC